MPRSRELAAELWGNCDGRAVREHRLGKGRVVWGKPPEEVLAAVGLPPDISCGTKGPMPVRYIHRRTADGTEIYFIANRSDYARDVQCRFRTVGKWPELWWPESGRIEPAAAKAVRGGTLVPLRLESTQSVFVVFRPHQPAAEHVVSLTRDGRPIPSPAGPPPKIVIKKATYGVLTDPKRTRDVRAKLQAILDRGVTSFQVAKMAQGDDPALNIVKTLVVEYTSQGRPRKATGQDPDTLDLLSAGGAEHVADLRQDAGGRLAVEAWQPGRYEVADHHRPPAGRTGGQAGRAAAIDGLVAGAIPARRRSTRARDPRKARSPGASTPTAGVKYFSGTATYRKTFCLADDLVGPQSRVYLDLGRVQVMAEVKLNGKDLGILWKPPYRVDITGGRRARPQQAGGRGHQPLDQPHDRRRAVARGQRPQSRTGRSRPGPSGCPKASPAPRAATPSPPGGYGRRTRRWPSRASWARSC